MSIREEGGLNSAGGERGGPQDLVQESAGCILRRTAMPPANRSS